MQARIVYHDGKVELAGDNLEELPPKVKAYVEKLMEYHRKNMNILRADAEISASYGSLELNIIPGTKL